MGAFSISLFKHASMTFKLTPSVYLREIYCLETGILEMKRGKTSAIDVILGMSLSLSLILSSLSSLFHTRICPELAMPYYCCPFDFCFP